jgi:hypothetical protein
MKATRSHKPTLTKTTMNPHNPPKSQDNPAPK